MKVLMASSFYVMGGSSVVIENITNNLSKAGIDVTIGAFVFKRLPPIGNHCVKKIPIFNPIKLKKFLKKFDIVHSHHALTNYLALFGPKAFVYHYHGAPNIGFGYMYRLSMISSIKLMKHSFDAIISVSESGASELEHYFGIDDVNVIYNGVDTKLFNNELNGKFRMGKPQFLFVGNLYAHKNVEELICTMNKIILDYPQAYLQIVGYGETYNFLKRLIKKLKLERHVGLVGRVSKEELPYYYSSCDVYVTASTYEVCPVPLLEAMAFGKPVVASSIPPHIELITKSEAGAICTADEPFFINMKKIYETRKKYKNNAITFAKNHEWSLVANDILSIYSKILK